MGSVDSMRAQNSTSVQGPGLDLTEPPALLFRIVSVCVRLWVCGCVCVVGGGRVSCVYIKLHSFVSGETGKAEASFRNFRIMKHAGRNI